jgi:hypothetical protein
LDNLSVCVVMETVILLVGTRSHMISM